MPRATPLTGTFLMALPRTYGSRPMTTPTRMTAQKAIWLVVSVSEYQTQATTAATGAATVSSTRDASGAPSRGRAARSDRPPMPKPIAPAVTNSRVWPRSPWPKAKAQTPRMTTANDSRRTLARTKPISLIPRPATTGVMPEKRAANSAAIIGRLPLPTTAESRLAAVARAGASSVASLVNGQGSRSPSPGCGDVMYTDLAAVRQPDCPEPAGRRSREATSVLIAGAAGAGRPAARRGPVDQPRPWPKSRPFLALAGCAVAGTSLCRESQSIDVSR